jgi:hypothetical protein
MRALPAFLNVALQVSIRTTDQRRMGQLLDEVMPLGVRVNRGMT